MPKNNKGAIFVFVFFLLAGSNDGNQTKANLNDIQENRDQKHDDKLDLSVTNNNDHKSETKINEIKANSNLRPEKETRLKSKTLSKMAAGSLRYRNRSSSSSNMTDGDSSSISARTGKLFSLFNIVTFRKSQCDASSGSKGTCMAVSECATMGGGVAQGNCAAGFGVCCVITQSECGSVIQNNCTYIQNPGFPGKRSSSGN